jgi:NAD(P)-dependent dehydrogenase (short-subunit alcohol dehydrogenase family)
MGEQRDLGGLSALVTGATSGSGQAAAEELARHGPEVIVHGRDRRTRRGGGRNHHQRGRQGQLRR